MKRSAAAFCAALALAAALTGCGSSSSEAASPAASVQAGTTGEVSAAPAVTELTVRFGDGGEPYTLHLETNSTAAAIAGYVGATTWRLPVYSYDESDVMEYYDIPGRYDIPDNSSAVTAVHAGEVYYSDPNRIVLYYRDAEVSEEYTLIGAFDATEDFVTAVETNPVLDGWGNQIVIISDGE